MNVRRLLTFVLLSSLAVAPGPGVTHTQSEYHVTWQDHTHLPDVPAAYHAANRAHNLRVYFAPEGLVVVPRVQGEGWRWELRLTAWGREGALQPAGAATLHPHANRIEYRRGGLTEWYLNDERGLEQGFQIANRKSQTCPEPCPERS